MKIKTFIVNLKGSTDRKENTRKEIAPFSFMDAEFVEAVDGRRLTEIEIKRLFDRERFHHRTKRYPVAGEIGCTMSHLKCYHLFLSTPEPYALILEDDVLFVRPDDVEKVMGEGIRLLESKRTDIVLFTDRILLYPDTEKLFADYELCRIHNAYGTHAYLINRKAAQRLIQQSPAYTFADDFAWMRSLRLQIQSIYPSIAIGGSTAKIVDMIIESERFHRRPYIKKTLYERILNKLEGVCRRFFCSINREKLVARNANFKNHLS